MEFTAKESFRGIEKPLKDLKLKSNLIVAGILRENDMILPDGDTDIEVGDCVVVVTTNEAMNDLNDILA